MPSAFVPHRIGFIMVLSCQFWYWLGWSVYNFIYLPEFQRLLRDNWPSAEWLVNLEMFVFNFFWLLAIFSFIRTHCSSPGGGTDSWRSFVRKQKLEIYEPRFAWQPAQATWCSKCRDVRPERTHHCSSTNECVLRFDHYCPWTANSIGHHNHKFFLLVAIYTFLANIVAFATMLPMAVAIVAGWINQDPFSNSWQKALLVVVVCLQVPQTMTFSDMCRDHVAKAYRNITSVEVNYKNMSNPYDRGSNRANLEEILGKFGLDWFFPIMPRHPVSDGISFARRCEPCEPSTASMKPDALLYYRYCELGPMEESLELSVVSSEGESEMTDD